MSSEQVESIEYASPSSPPALPVAVVPVGWPARVWHAMVEMFRAPGRAPLPLRPDGAMSGRVKWGTAVFVAAMYAALWSPHWYPLSDSSLYLKMAKGLAGGESIDFIRKIHRSIRPMTPLMLSWILKAGGGFGAMHVTMIGMMLGSLGLTYLTLRNWWNERIGYWATLVTALSWWTFSNATTIMTEPPFLLFFWGSLYAFSCVGRRRTAPWQWGLVVLGTGLLWLAWCNRVAAIFFLPGVMAGLFLTTRGVATARTRAAWCGLVAVVFAVSLWGYMRPVPIAPADQAETGGNALGIKDVGDTTPTETYRLNSMLGITNPVVQLPSNGGRWVLEVIAAGLYYPHKAGGWVLPAIGAVLAIVAFGLFLRGWWAMFRGAHWWAAGLALYFIPLWIMWGSRVKPRYMVPVAPILFVMLWTGMAVVGRWLVRKRADASPAEKFAGAAKWSLGAIVVVSVGLNGFAYGVEAYVRHGTREEFYDVARRGWNGEAIDVCTYVHKHTHKEDRVWLNRGADRRMVSLLTDRETRQVRKEVKVKNAADTEALAAVAKKMMEQMHDPAPTTAEAAGAGKGGKKGKPRAKAAAGAAVPVAATRPVAATGPATTRTSTTHPWSSGHPQYVVVYFEEPAWPRFHWPIAHRPAAEDAPRWWQLYVLDEASGTLWPVAVPRDRTSMHRVLTYESKAR